MPKIQNKIRFGAPVTLLGGGPCESGDLALALGHAPHLVAADGGADRALELGHVPERVIGDMDSLGPVARDTIAASHLIAVADQDTTDFQKCLDRIEAPLILAIGMWGGRADHTMAAMHTLVAHKAPCLVIAPEDVIFAAPPTSRLGLPEGTRVSLFPMGEVTGTSQGLHWPIDGLAFAPSRLIGTSNHATGPVSLSFDGPGMLVFLPRDQLHAAIAAVARS